MNCFKEEGVKFLGMITADLQQDTTSEKVKN